MPAITLQEEVLAVKPNACAIYEKREARHSCQNHILTPSFVQLEQHHAYEVKCESGADCACQDEQRLVDVEHTRMNQVLSFCVVQLHMSI